MTAKDLTLSQVFCCDVLLFFPRHKFCVNQGFHFVGSSFILCFLERIKWLKSPLFSLMGLFLGLSIYTCISSTASSVFVLSASIHFPSIAILSSESPSSV